MIGESGFGSPSYTPEAEQKDAGFGDPYTEGYRDTGFGSPQDIIRELSLAAVVSPSAGLEVSDDGGERVTIYHSSLFADGVLVSVSFVAQNGTVYPAIGGARRTSMVSSVDGQRLSFFTPMMPLGQYSVRIAIPREASSPFEQSTVDKVTLSTPIIVSPRHRCAETYVLKRFFSPAFSVGKRHAYGDSPSAFGNLEGILQSVGTYLNRLSGKPHTYSTARWAWGESLQVESTYGFSSSGKLVFGDNLLSYSGKTDAEFTGVIVLNGYETEHAAATEVTQYV